MSMNHSTRYTNEQLIQAVKNSKSTANVCRILGIVPIGGNYKTINNKIKSLEINTDHFTRQGWNKGMKFPGKGIPLKQIMIKNSSYTNIPCLKRRILEVGLFKRECMKCKRITWNKKPIPLELHHKNGNHSDHRSKNIEILCPNCHAFTDNYRGRNV
jgi:hypothetical protein